MRHPDSSPTPTLRPLATAAWDHTPAWLPTLTRLLRAQGAADLVPAVGQVQGAGWAAVQPLMQAAGLEAQVATKPLSAVIAEGLPVALLLRSGDACILTGCRTVADGRTECSLVLPGLDGDDVFNASVAELSSEYSGQRLRLRLHRAPDGAGRPQPRPVPLRAAPVLRSAVQAAELPRLDELVCTDEALAPGLPVAAAPVSVAVSVAAIEPAAVALPSWMMTTADAADSPLRRGGAGAWATTGHSHRAGSAALAWGRLQGLRQAVSSAAAGLRQGVQQFGQGLAAVATPAAAPAISSEPALLAVAATAAAAPVAGDLLARGDAPVPAPVSAPVPAAVPAPVPVPSFSAALARAATRPAAASAAADAALRPAAVPANPPAVVAEDSTAPMAAAAVTAEQDNASAIAPQAWWQRVQAAQQAQRARRAPGLAACPMTPTPTPAAEAAATPAAPVPPRVLPVLTEVLHGPQEVWPAGAARPISTRLALGDDPNLWRHTAPAAAVSVLSDLPVLAWPDSWPVIDPDAAVPASADALLAAVLPVGTADGADAADIPADAVPPGSTRPRKPLRPLPRTAGRVPARTQWCGVPRAQAGRTAAANGASSPAGAVR